MAKCPTLHEGDEQPMADKDEQDSKKTEGSEEDELDLDKIDEEAEKLLKDAVDKDDDEDDDDGADQLGDAGKRALERIKAGRRAAREERDSLRSQLEKVNAELRKHSDKDKSETQRLQEERDELKKALDSEKSARQRREAAEEYAPDDAPAKLIRAAAKYINGSTDEELKASAEQFYELFSDRPAKKEVAGPPKEKLRGGGRSSDVESEETDPRKLAEMISRAR